MNQLLNLLKTIPEYRTLLNALSQDQSAAITGIGQINRSHIIAGLHKDGGRPLVLVCQDELAAKRLQEELKSFLGQTVPSLPSRELTLYDTAVVSRSWEQKRLRQLYELATAQTPVQILSWDALSQRTMPRDTLLQSAFTLQTGQEYDMEGLLQKLSSAGYSRCGMVEGPGQYALRGGILDIFSPAADRPFRAEFFGDELDTMG